MPDLGFAVEGAAPLPHCATPTLALRLRVTDRELSRVQSVQVACQVRIEARGRRYSDGEKDRLFELFGEPARWSRTVGSLLWTHASVAVPAFVGTALVDLPVPCTFDLNALAAKYFHALDEAGEVPLLLLFSGTVFFIDDDGLLRVGPISWSEEASYRLPVAVWKSMIDTYYPGVVWLCLRRDVHDRLATYRLRRALPRMDDAIESLLQTAGEPAAP